VLQCVGGIQNIFAYPNTSPVRVSLSALHVISPLLIRYFGLFSIRSTPRASSLPTHTIATVCSRGERRTVEHIRPCPQSVTEEGEADNQEMRASFARWRSHRSGCIHHHQHRWRPWFGRWTTPLARSWSCSSKSVTARDTSPRKTHWTCSMNCSPKTGPDM
jgi:hypothetical protein